MDPAAARRLIWVLLGNALMRIAGGSTGILVGLYLADLASTGAPGVNAALAGTLGAVSFGAELLGAIPMGLLSDAFAPRGLMTFGALLGAAATQLFGLTSATSIFFVSRSVEGLGAAASVPALLAHLTDISQNNYALRTRVMGYFEITLLAGLALGSVFGGELWSAWGREAFGFVALLYLAGGALLYVGAAGSRGYGIENALVGFRKALQQKSLQRLAPIWLCANTIVGLWLGPTLPFLLTERFPANAEGQTFAGVFADAPENVGYIMLGYAVVFSLGVTMWTFILPRITMVLALRVGIGGMLAACVALYTLNHAGGAGSLVQRGIWISLILCILVESGTTPAALSLLAGAIGGQAGRGAAMGIYSVLLSLGAVTGSLMAGFLGEFWSIDGLIYGTFAMSVIAFGLLGTLLVEDVGATAAPEEA